MLSLFDFSVSELPKAYASIVAFVRENPLLCGALFIENLAFEIFLWDG